MMGLRAREQGLELAVECNDDVPRYVRADEGKLRQVLVNLVGQQAAVSGTSRVFETLQNVTLNKQIFYGVLELIMFELFPELAQSQAAQQIKSFSL